MSGPRNANPERDKSYHETRQHSQERAILAVIARIPKGSVATYGQVANLAGLPGRARLVGRVLRDLPATAMAPVDDEASRSGKLARVKGRRKSVPETVLWHRVINSQGCIALPKNSLSHVEQRQRLRDEGVIFKGDRIDLRQYQWRAFDESPLLD